MAQIFWAAGLQVMAAWYIATETTSELKKGGYVQGTVILVVRKRCEAEVGYRDEIVHEVKAEVARQIETLMGLNQNARDHGRVENLFEDADLQMAGYAAALRVLILLGSDRRSIEREQIKRAVRDREVRLVVATDAACEGLNLQTLGTLINVDLPWNPSRLEQRIGRIKRFGQRRSRVDMLNLVYQGTIDEKVYSVLSKRMQDKYDLFGSLPDVIDDKWIDDVENLEEYMSQFIEQKRNANAFDLRYADSVDTMGPRWEVFEKVLARHDVVERLSKPWNGSPRT